jgi:hypothetical protein
MMLFGHLASGAEGEGEMTASRMRQLEEMAAKLSATARNLPLGQDRQNAFQEIARFRDKITALKKNAELRSAPAPRAK